MRNIERVCPSCGRRFTAKRGWAVFDSSRCKEFHRRENEAIGARFRELGPTIHARLGAAVAQVAAQQPLLAEAVAEIAALHAELGGILHSVRPPSPELLARIPRGDSPDSAKGAADAKCSNDRET